MVKYFNRQIKPSIIVKYNDCIKKLKNEKKSSKS